MSILSAKEANRIASAAVQKRIPKEEKILLKKIERAAHRGDFSIKVGYFAVHEETLHHLHDTHGFNWYMDNGPTYLISWEDAE